MFGKDVPRQTVGLRRENTGEPRQDLGTIRAEYAKGAFY